MSALDARLAAVFGRSSNAALALALRQLEAQDTLTPAERMTNAWISDEILRRFPDADAALDAWAEQDAPAMTYTETLLKAAGL